MEGAAVVVGSAVVATGVVAPVAAPAASDRPVHAVRPADWETLVLKVLARPGVDAGGQRARARARGLHAKRNVDAGLQQVAPGCGGGDARDGDAGRRDPQRAGDGGLEARRLGGAEGCGGVAGDR